MASNTCILSSIMNKYIVGSMCYGFVRKLPDLYDAKVEKSIREENKYITKQVPLLITDKTYILALSTVMSPILFPFSLMKDVKNLEIWARNLNQHDYEFKITKTDFMDYVFP